MVSKHDVSKEDEARTLIEEALNKGPVGGIFNLAMVGVIIYSVQGKRTPTECTHLLSLQFGA